MGEVVRMIDINGGGDGGDDERVLEWEAGLPSSDDLTPLSQPLVPLELASAFKITPEPCRTPLDVNRASQSTFSAIRGQSQSFSSNNFKSFNEERSRDPVVVEPEETGDRDGSGSGSGSGSESRKMRKVDCAEEADSAMGTENSNDDPSARTLKRPRLVWTPQLHKRFVDVVAHLGIKNAVPKTIMQLMNVEGLTRENVASHLQKYRLYLKRMQGLSNEGPSSSDHLFASTPVPQSLHDSGGSVHGNGHGNGHMPVPIPMPYGQTMMHMPFLGLSHGHGHGHMGMPGPGGYHGYESYNMLQQRDWSVVSYPNVGPNDQ